MLHTNPSLRSIVRAFVLSLFVHLLACSSTHAPELDAGGDAGVLVFAQDACARALVAFELVDECASSAFVCPWDTEGPPVELAELDACIDALEESSACDDAAASLAGCRR